MPPKVGAKNARKAPAGKSAAPKAVPSKAVPSKAIAFKASSAKAHPVAPPAKSPTKAEPAPAKAAASKGAPAKAAVKFPSSPSGSGAAAAKALKAEEEQNQQTEADAEAQKKADEEEQKKQLAAEAEAERKKTEAEAEQKRKKEKENGDVVMKYNMYADKFPIKGGKITAAEIDDLYCLSDAMPGCKIHLSTKGPEEKYKIECDSQVFPYIFEEPVGTFHDLQAGEAYFVYVEEDETEFLKSQEKAKQNFAGVKSVATRGEGCSCIEGNPCASECDAQGNTVCLDWPNRFAVAKAHGWIGYQAK